MAGIVKTGQAVTAVFATSSPVTGAATSADSTPTGTLYVNGTADAATVTVTNITTGRYKAAVTLPTLAAGDVVDIHIAATVGGIAGGGVVWSAAADTKRLSDTLSADVVAISGDSAAADNLEAAADGSGYNLGGGSVVAASVSGAVGSVTGAVGSVTGAVGSVTGNVGGNVVGSVGSVTGAVGSVGAGGITAASIATGAIDADALAADAGAKLADTILRRTAANIEASANGDALSIESVYGLIMAAFESAVSSTTWTIRQTGGSTLGTKTVAVDADADPIVSVT